MENLKPKNKNKTKTTKQETTQKPSGSSGEDTPLATRMEKTLQERFLAEALASPSRKRLMPEGSGSESGSEGTWSPQKKRMEEGYDNVFHMQMLEEAEMYADSGDESDERNPEESNSPIGILLDLCDQLVERWESNQKSPKKWKDDFGDKLEQAKACHEELRDTHARLIEAEDEIYLLKQENEKLKAKLEQKAPEKHTKDTQTIATPKAQQNTQRTKGQQKGTPKPPAQKPDMVRSYAAVTMSKKQLIDKRPLRHVVTVFQDHNVNDSEKTRAALSQCFDPCAENLQLKAVKKINRGGILIETKSKEDLEKLLESQRIKDTGLTVGIPPKKDPKMVIYNAPAMTDEELRAAIAKQNEDMTPEMIGSIKPLFKIGRDKANWVVQASPSTRAILVKKSRVFLQWHACHIRDYVVAGRCYRCQAFGHIARHCRATVDTCGHCAHEGHSFKECPNKEKAPSCINCKRAKRPHKHSSRSDECPAYKYAIANLVSKTDYGAAN